MYKFFALTILILWGACTNVFGYSVDTHKEITDAILFSDDYGVKFERILTENLGLLPGLSYVLDDKALKGKGDILYFIKYGSEREDDPSTVKPVNYFQSRYVNHFHNPLKSIENAGLTDLARGDSTILWAQKKVMSQNGGYYSWNDVRDYYYQALTATNNWGRLGDFTNTFRGIGQLMHLVQDMAVPAHTRNDGHVWRNYETRVDEKRRNNSNWIKDLLPTGRINAYPFDELNKQSEFAEAPVPISRLFDINVYDGSNPLDTLASNIGLAEFTNANFLSVDTISSSVDLPHPESSLDANPCVNLTFRERPEDAGSLGPVNRAYYEKSLDCSEINKYLLVGESYIASEVDNMMVGSGEMPSAVLELDNNVYDEYADILIPQAATYSTALLKYFFRGELEVEGYELTDSLGAVEELQFFVTNKTPNEAIAGGLFAVAYSYNMTVNGKVETIRGVSSTVSSEQQATDVKSQYRVNFLSSGKIPADATDVSYTLVYRGPLGFEDDAVIGKVVQIKTLAGLEIKGFDITDSYGNIYAVQFFVKNSMTNNEVIDPNGNTGTFSFTYSYKDSNGATVTKSSDTIPSGTLLYGEEMQYAIMMPWGDEIPVGATDIAYTLVYRGALGATEKVAIREAMNIRQPVWEEHWNNGLKGNHPWQYSGVDLPVDGAIGSVDNVVAGGFLEKTNIRLKGVQESQVNEAILTLPAPVTVSENAEIFIKLDEMSISPVLSPQPDCTYNHFELPAAQKVRFKFMLGDGSITSFHYTLEGHNDFGSYITLNPGQPVFTNIYGMLQYMNGGQPVPKPVKLVEVVVRQQLYGLCEDVFSDQVQSMTVDYMRIIDDATPANP